MTRKDYIIFSRHWWRQNPKWPNGLEPHIGRKTHICYASTEDEARAICRKWNEDYKKKHKTNRYSIKAEYKKY
jgi:hypothetical protein